MERDEQKPKDILLNGEIKEEMEDFLENWKEEPTEEKYSEQIIPKLEEITEPHSFSTSYSPAQANNLIHPVRKFFAETPLFPKLDTAQQDHFELTIPKLEESLEPSTSDKRNQDFRPNNPIQNYFVKTQKAFPKLVITPQKERIADRYCAVCLKMCPNLSVKTVVRDFDKLVIMIGCILRGDYSFKHAQLFMSRRSHVGICRKHFFDAINEIFKFLDIKHPDEIASCSVRNMMITVNAIIPQITTSQFCGILYDFALVNTTWKRNPSIAEFRCSVCTLNQSIKNMAYLTSPNDKLMIMIGSILRGDYTVEDARLFLKQKRGSNICCSHFIETINAIFSLLHIKNFEEFHDCSFEAIENVMATVYEVNTWVTISNFWNILCDFVERNKKYLNMTSTSSRAEREEQQREEQHILMSEREVKQETEDSSNNVKEEHEEVKYQEEIMTEIKKEIDPCQPMNVPESTEATGPKNRTEECFMQTESSIKTRRVYIFKRRIRNKNDRSNRTCSVCSQMQNAQNRKCVTLEEEKLVLMVGCVLSGQYTLDQAQQFMSRKMSSNICLIHFTKAFEEIFKYLAISHPHEIFACSVELLRDVMLTVNSIDPQIRIVRFCNILSSFVKRNFVLNS